MSSKHYATFSWGVGPQSVHIAGNFNAWSDTASPLHKQTDGTFSADVAMPWGEKQAFKYVVDGEWKVREDEAKEWDAAGNMNNVYTAPHAPSSATGAATGPAPTAKSAASVSPSTAPDTAPPTASRNTEPETLMAASAPPAASGGAYSLGAVDYSNLTPRKGPSSSSASAATSSALYDDFPSNSAASTTATTATPAVVTQTAVAPTHVQIEKTAANASIGEAGTEAESQTYMAKAAQYGGSAMAALGAIVGGAAVVVEKATGVDLTHSHEPMTVDEASAKGIDADTLPNANGPTDAVSPAATKPSGSGVAALDEKLQNLRMDDSPSNSRNVSTSADGPTPLPKEEAPANDIPAQVETTDNHTHVPMPVITDVSEKDPKKDRTLHSDFNDDTVGTKPVSSDPGDDARSAKDQAENHPRITGPTSNAPISGLPSGTPVATPDAQSSNLDAPAPPAKPSSAPTTSSLGPAGTIPSSSSTANTTPSNAVAHSIPAAAPVIPATTAPLVATTASPSSAASTPASTPVESGHSKHSTDGSDVRKKKSSFFHKIKSRFQNKD